jgi:hypothetical protein
MACDISITFRESPTISPQRLQRHLSVEPAQVLGRQPLQVFPQMDHAQAIDVLGPVGADLDAVVEGDDVGAAVQLVGADRFQQSEAHALLRGRRAGMDVEYGQVGMAADVRRQEPVLGGDEQPGAVEQAEDLFPVEVRLRQHQHRVGGQLADEPRGRLQQRNGLVRQRHA